MEKYKFESKKEEGLLEQALKELGVKENQVFHKISEEKVGILKTKKYTLEIVKIEDVGELGKEILTELLEGLNLTGKIETKIKENQINYEIYSSNNSLLIGKKGHILQSIQVFVRQAIYNRLDVFVNISIDVENYKEKQIFFLEKNVKRIAREVTLSKVAVKLDPMNSYERKLVHDALTGFKYIDTTSEGEEPNRCVVIKYKEKAE